MAAATLRRIRWEVLPLPARDAVGDLAGCRWQVSRDGERIAAHEIKRHAVEFAVVTCRSAWRAMQQRASLRIKGLTGRIQDERTYGADPTTTKG